MSKFNEIEKLLKQYEIVEPSGGTDREIIEMARKKIVKSQGNVKRTNRFRLLAAIVLLASTGVALFFILNRATSTGIPEKIAENGTKENVDSSLLIDHVHMPETAREFPAEMEEKLADISAESQDNGEVPGPEHEESVDIFEQNTSAAVIVADAFGSVTGDNGTIKRGDIIDEGDRVRTGLESMCLVYGRDGSIFKLNTDTEVVFESLHEDRLVNLVKGECFVDAAPVSEERPNPLIIQTGNARATVVGTVLSIKATSLGTLLSVKEGSVNIATEGGFAIVGTSEQCLANGREMPVVQSLLHVKSRFGWTEMLSKNGQHPIEKARSAAHVSSAAGSVGSLVAKSSQGWQPLTLDKMNVTVVIEGNIARTTVDQVFHNNSSRQLEGRFKFPLPKDASICRFAMTVDSETLMEGSIVERIYARKIYESIVSRRRDPGLLEWQYGSTFSARIFPIFARSDKRIVISYTQPLSTFEGLSSYTFPMVGDLMTEMPPEEFSLVLKLVAGEKIEKFECPSHHVADAVDSESSLRVGFRANNYSARNDFVFNWKEKSSQLDIEQTRGEDGYLLMRIRPDLSEFYTDYDENVVILIDTSASTAPNEREIIYNTVEKLLMSMNSSQKFIIGLVDVNTRFIGDSFLQVTRKNVDSALSKVWMVEYAGATNLEKCAGVLARFLKEKSDASVIYLGDGQPTMGQTRIPELTQVFKQKLLKKLDHFHAVGIGTDVNEMLLSSISSSLDGILTTLRPGDDLIRKVAMISRTIHRPILTDARLEIEGNCIRSIYPEDIAPIPAGGECAILARFVKNDKVSIKLKGVVSGKSYEQEVSFKTGVGVVPEKVLGRIWAQRRIIDLLAGDSAGRNKNEIIELSKMFSIVTPYTSFLVLETEQDYKKYNIDREKAHNESRFEDHVESPDDGGGQELSKLRELGIPVDRIIEREERNRRAPTLSKDVPVIVTRREFAGQEFDETIRRDIFKSPRIEAEKMVEKPIIILEEEVEITRDIPRGTSFDNLSNKNLDSTSVIDAYGIGGGRAGAYGQRWGKGSLAREGGSPGTESAVTAALRWLHFHQDDNGQWDQDGFQKNCDTRKGSSCDGQGTSQYDVANTGLALLAFLGNGNTHRTGVFKNAVKKGLDWLKSQQQEDGSFGPRLTESWIYNHAIATMALSEAYAITRDYRLREPLQKAVGFILDAQNPGLGWGHEPGSGQNDTSVTGWLVQALKAARTAGLDVDRSIFEGAIKWFDRATNTTGKCGYIRPGDDGPVIRDVNDKYAKLPTMTAVSVICRIFCGQSRRDPKLLKGVDILMQNLPDWNKPINTNVNSYYWFWGTLALYQYGGRNWQAWNRAMK